MALKQLEVPGVGLVTFQKRRGTRSIRIAIHGPEVKVTMPFWAPYREAIRFTATKHEWIKQNRTQKPILSHGDHVGLKHTIITQPGDSLRTRVTNDKIVVSLPDDIHIESPLVQKRLATACERVLKQETLKDIVPRLKDLAYEHGCSLGSVQVKKLKRRWGSCDRQGNITLNIYLAQLPWKYIEYVLLHELTHIEYFSHDKQFWSQLEQYYPGAKKVRRTMRDYQPHLQPR